MQGARQAWSKGIAQAALSHPYKEQCAFKGASVLAWLEERRGLAQIHFLIKTSGTKPAMYVHLWRSIYEPILSLLYINNGPSNAAGQLKVSDLRT